MHLYYAVVDEEEEEESQQAATGTSTMELVPSIVLNSDDILLDKSSFNSLIIDVVSNAASSGLL